MSIRFDGRVAIVTGAGSGLGRSHAIGLAARGAKVIVNDLSPEAARRVVEEIDGAGGQAVPMAANVGDYEQVSAMVDKAVSMWGRVDVLVNNAGILRDKTFAKMNLADFRLILDVHLMGSVNCTKAVWEIMRTQRYGRIVMTTSASGIYGNFGQSNYAAAKSGVVGLMNVLSMEGEKNGIKVNSLAPSAATPMTEGILSTDDLTWLAPETVTPGLLFLVSENAPNGVILGAGAGCFAVAQMIESEGVVLTGDKLSPEGVEERFQEIADLTGGRRIANAIEQSVRYVRKAAVVRQRSIETI
jgi:NAD(P)-dependent dehydrogenase (short-subunit alcohol dehydrogenase family)